MSVFYFMLLMFFRYWLHLHGLHDVPDLVLVRSAMKAVPGVEHVIQVSHLLQVKKNHHQLSKSKYGNLNLNRHNVGLAVHLFWLRVGLLVDSQHIVFGLD